MNSLPHANGQSSGMAPWQRSALRQQVSATESKLLSKESDEYNPMSVQFASCHHANHVLTKRLK
jgi:hypothetical protein